MTDVPTAVPDLLRRFASAPYSATMRMGGAALRVETNDPAILTELQKASAQLSRGGSDGLLLLKIVRDTDAPCGRGEVTVLSAFPLITLRVGIGTIVVLDCERREALGFLASEVTAEHFACTLFPLIRSLLTNSVSATAIVSACQ